MKFATKPPADSATIHSFRRVFLAVAAPIVLIATVALPTVARADNSSISPFGFGPYTVGCSDIAQDLTRVPPGQSPIDFWEGTPNGDTGRYITDLLADPAGPMRWDLTIPDDAALYGNYAGQTYPYVMLVCYPTPASNSRPDYMLPTGNAVPHMQRAGDDPVSADPTARYPVLLFSTGLMGSPISSDYISALRLFASWGYVVVAPFPGDGRFANLQLDDLRDEAYALLHLKDYVAMQAVRPLSLSRALDAILANPKFAANVEPSQVVGFGASLGGESLLLMGGAQLTTTLGQSSNRVTLDPRLIAAVGYVPYFGLEVLPAFGRNQQGLDNVTLPYLAISGTADTSAPIEATYAGIQRLRNTRQLVALAGVPHGFDPAFADDIFTWSLAFLAGELRGSPAIRARSARMTNVAGGGDDTLLVDYVAPSPPADAGERAAIEYHNAALDHYFYTADPDEVAMLDAAVTVPGWNRTGFAFKVRPAGDPRGLPACRFFGTPGLGLTSHFYTIDPTECAIVRNNPLWAFETFAFNTDVPTTNDCSADRVPVVRLYNNGMDGQASHRYLTSRSEALAMLQSGWLAEGVVFCAIP